MAASRMAVRSAVSPWTSRSSTLGVSSFASSKVERIAPAVDSTSARAESL
jgi:hypothetical protein